jgi:hypothetical protein
MPRKRSAERLLDDLLARRATLRPQGDGLRIEGTDDPALLMKAHRHRRALLALLRTSS